MEKTKLSIKHEARAMQLLMPFGKHNGNTLGDLLVTERDYLQWLVDNNDRGDSALHLVIDILLERE